jgi:hypothetical protein
MKRIAYLTIAVCVSFAGAAFAVAAEANPREAKVVAEIAALGGRVTLDEKTPDRSVVAVDLCWNDDVDDAVLERLDALANLRSLDLHSCHGVTDAGMVHISRLPSLQCL